MRINVFIIFRLYLNMAGKSFTQRERFLNVNVPIIGAECPDPTILNLIFFALNDCKFAVECD